MLDEIFGHSHFGRIVATYIPKLTPLIAFCWVEYVYQNNSRSIQQLKGNTENAIGCIAAEIYIILRKWSRGLIHVFTTVEGPSIMFCGHSFMFYVQ
jgi:hypothetical protein